MELTAFLDFDKSVFQWIESTFFDMGLGGLLTPFLTAVTHLADFGIIWIILAAVLFIFKKTRKYGMMIAGALACMVVFNDLILKNVIARPRPFDLEQWKDWFVYPELIPRPKDLSFPSGHTSCSFASAAALTTTKKPWAYIPAFILAALIGFSRIYVHVHYCTDVIFGAAAGIVYGVIAIFAVKLIIRFINEKTKLKLFE